MLVGGMYLTGQTYLWDRVDGADLTDQFTVALEEKQQLEVQLIEPLTELQLLRTTEATETSDTHTDTRSKKKRNTNADLLHREKCVSDLQPESPCAAEVKRVTFREEKHQRYNKPVHESMCVAAVRSILFIRII